MRYTYGSIAAITVGILLLAGFWPGPQTPLTPQGLAQTQTAPTLPADPGVAPATVADGRPTTVAEIPFQGSKEHIEAALAKPLPKIDFFQMSLRDLIFNLGDMTELTIKFDPALLNDTINPDELVDLEFPEKTISAKTLLNLTFKAIQCDGEVAYTIRDNFVLITYIEDTTEVVIYNCRDLIDPIPLNTGGLGRIEDDDSDGVSDISFVQFGGGGFGGEGGGFGGGYGVPGLMLSPEQQLIQVITGTVKPESWTNNGGPGSIQSINGLIVINHTRDVHDQVKNLLQLLREATKEGGSK